MGQCKHVIVKGKVQGVYFRDYIKRTADSFGIFGWVKNLSNGNVEIIMVGEDSILFEMERKIWDGSSFSHVESVSVDTCDKEIKYSSFKIIR